MMQCMHGFFVPRMLRKAALVLMGPVRLLFVAWVLHELPLLLH
jgi:hypothetical protein